MSSSTISQQSRHTHCDSTGTQTLSKSSCASEAPIVESHKYTEEDVHDMATCTQSLMQRHIARGGKIVSLSEEDLERIYGGDSIGV